MSSVPKIACFRRQRNPSLHLQIGGHSEVKASALAAQLGNATGVKFDVNDAGSLGLLGDKPDLVVWP